jgi:hypothetical protein
VKQVIRTIPGFAAAARAPLLAASPTAAASR